MSVDIAPLLDDVFSKLGAFLLDIVPAGTTGRVVQAAVNRVPQPKGNHVVMRYLGSTRLQTNVRTYDDPFPAPGGIQATQTDLELRVQLDFYGSRAGEWSAAATCFLRDELGVTALDPACAPLHADDAVQMPLATGEEEYLQRWMLTAFLQWNPVATRPQQFADTLDIALKNVDVEYPP